MFFIAYAFKAHVQDMFAGCVKIVNSLVLQDKSNIEIILSPVSDLHLSADKLTHACQIELFMLDV